MSTITLSAEPRRASLGRAVRPLVIAAAVACTLAGAASSRAASASYTGNFDRADRVQLFNFTLGSSSTVTLKTLSYSGGTNAAGQAVASGGFDPILSLFGPTGAQITYNDDNGSGSFDSLISSSLAAGSYTLSLSRYPNFARGPTLANGWNNSTGSTVMSGVLAHWAVDLLGVSSASLGSQALAGGGGSWLNATNVNNAWSTASNWGNGAPPTSSDDATFGLNSVYAVQLGSDEHAANVTVEDSNLTLTGTTAAHKLTLGGGLTVAEAHAAALTIDGGTLALTSADNGTVVVGDHNTGTFAAQNGATVTAARGLAIGNDTGSTGTATFTGAGTTGTFAAPVTIGGSGSGTLNVLNGASVTTLGKTSMGVVANGDALVVQGAVGGVAAQYGTTVLAVGGYQSGSGYTAGGSASVTIGTGGVVNVSSETRVLNDASRINLSGGTLSTVALDLGNSNVARFNWSSGILDLNGGNITGLNATLAVPNNGTLAGVGTVGGAISVASGGHLAPGNGAGTLHVGSTALASGANFDVDLAGSAAGQFDVLDVAGSVNLGGATLNLALLGGYAPAYGTTFTVVTNDGADAIVGKFANATPSGLGYDQLAVGGTTFRVDYAGGTGNDVTLTAVPEPATLGVIIGAAVVVLGRRRRRAA